MRTRKKAHLNELASRLKMVREHLGYSCRGMSRLFGLSPNAYINYEESKCMPSFQILNQLAADHNISMDWLLCNKGSMHFQEEQDQDQELQEQLAESRNKLEKLEKETAWLRQFSPEILEMIEHMEQNMTLYHEMLLHFNRFRDENPRIKKRNTGKAKKNPSNS